MSEIPERLELPRKLNEAELGIDLAWKASRESVGCNELYEVNSRDNGHQFAENAGRQWRVPGSPHQAKEQGRSRENVELELAG